MSITQVIHADWNTWLWETVPDTPIANVATTDIGGEGGGAAKRGLLHFPLGASGLTITSAVLSAKVASRTDAANASAARVLPAVGIDTTAGGIVGPTACWDFWKITDDTEFPIVGEAWASPGAGGSDTDFSATGIATSAIPAPGSWQTWDVATQFGATTLDYAVLLKHLGTSGQGATYSSIEGGAPAYLTVVADIAAPTGLTATEGTDGKTTLRWTRHGAADSIRVYAGDRANPTTRIATLAGDATEFVHVAFQGHRFYRLVAVSAEWGTSAYSADVEADSATLPVQTLDFGIGFLAGGDRSYLLRIVDHAGLDYPDMEIPATENSVLDGGKLGTERARMRRITVQMDADHSLSRSEIARLFAPGVERVLSTARGSLPYRVEALSFARASMRGAQRFTVTLLSPQGYAHYEAQYLDIPAGVAQVTTLTDVACPVRVSTIVSGTPTAVTITTPVGVTTLNGPFADSDVIVVDSGTQDGEHTVTVNGVSALAAFDRSGKWPRLEPGRHAVRVNQDGTPHAFSLLWYPRVVGLVV